MAEPFGAAPGILVGVGVGTAVAAAIEPAVELPKQDAWSRNANRVLPLGQLARLVAQGGVPLGEAEDEAAREGFSADKIARLAWLETAVPPIAEALTLWRRNLISDDLWTFVLSKTGVDTRYRAPLGLLKESEPLDSSIVAKAIIRSVITDPGFLPPSGSLAGGVVPPFPSSTIGALEEAAQTGISEERLRVETAITGLPPAPGELLQLLNRGVIQDGDFYRGVAEGDTRVEWGPFLIQLRRRLLSPHEYAELSLRGWIQDAEMTTGAALSGMQPADTALLKELLGRPLNVHDTVRALARGGTFGGDYAGVPEPYLSAIRESNIRPEWGNLAYHNRYTYPSAFVLRSLTQGGDITQAESEQILLFEGWEPTLAHTVSMKWAGGTTAVVTADPFVKRAQTNLWSATHRSYVNGDSLEVDARRAFAALGVTAAGQDEILTLWNIEAALVRRDLAASDIRKEFRGTLITEAEAIARLEQLGYSALDATNYLQLQ